MLENSLHRFFERRGREKNLHYDLERIRAALADQGNPQLSMGHSLIVGGTNGKGTTTLLLSAAIMESGNRVASFLSPHLQSLSERFLLNLEPIEESELEAMARRYESVAEEYRLTYFEFLTFLFFVWAKAQKVDFVVTEVGLGGKLDATNVSEPLASILTNVGLDHQQYLGDTLEEILADKLHIVRPEGLLFTGLEDPRLIQQAITHCESLDAIYYLSREINTDIDQIDWTGQRIRLNGHPFLLSSPALGHLKNAALAFLSLRVVFPKIEIATLQRAFARVCNPGRLEIVQEHPRVILSSDHNPHGQSSLFSSLETLPVGQLSTLCAFSLDKPYQKMYAALKERSDEILLTRVPDSSPPADYMAMGRYESNPLRAVEKLLQKADKEDTLLITGSTYLVGAVRRLWSPKVKFLRQFSSDLGLLHRSLFSGESLLH